MHGFRALYLLVRIHYILQHITAETAQLRWRSGVRAALCYSPGAAFVTKPAQCYACVTKAKDPLQFLFFGVRLHLAKRERLSWPQSRLRYGTASHGMCAGTANAGPKRFDKNGGISR